MNGKSGLAAVAIAMVVLVGLAPQAAAVDLAPHEKTYSAPGGLEFTVGHSEHAARPVGPLNGMPTNRDVFLDNTFYGQVSDGTGRLKTGYFVACAVDLKAKLDLGAEVGIDADASAHLGLSPESLLPGVDVSVGPYLSAGIGVDLSLTPGKVVDVPVGEKELLPGSTGYVFSRDRRVHVEDCAGPLTVQAYAIITAETPEVTAEGAVFGDPFTM
ncbi:MspA family porin [Nocardia amikacinitolerans]|uniref:MspA family porin n=1 Tax=Nocardia amikacinitolerans TaxID=756689 RepID=UPI0020A574EB|nr:MspA family porin [Nocardia amikacinitolerans]MCP2289229.1 MspA protein [Nocardia amikacinitolerans]